jgi:hypothetical protein
MGKTFNSLAHSHCGWLGFMMAHKGWIQLLCHLPTVQFMTGNRLRGIDTEDKFDMACECVILGLAIGIFFCSERDLTSLPEDPLITL